MKNLRRKNPVRRVILMACVLMMAAFSCSETDQEQLKRMAEKAAQTAAAEGLKAVETQADKIKMTAIAIAETEADQLKSTGVAVAETQAVYIKETARTQFATQLANLSGDLARKTPSPWDTSWVPSDSQFAIDKINDLLSGTGLVGAGEEILYGSRQYGVNPAFTLAMFRKEASFAAQETRARSNNNPGNIIATGNCRGLPTGSSCSGVYGEISTDGRFGVYASMADGIKAYFWLLEREYKPGTNRNCSDIACIVTVYCPPSECETNKYIDQITGWTREYQSQILTP